MKRFAHTLRQRMRGLVQSRVARFLLVREVEALMRRRPVIRYAQVPIYSLMGAMFWIIVIPVLDKEPDELQISHMLIPSAAYLAAALSLLWTVEFALRMRASRKRKNNTVKALP